MSIRFTAFAVFRHNAQKGAVSFMQNTQVADRIKKRSKESGITIKSLLESCGINRNFIYDLEKKGQIPTADKIERIADQLDCSVDYLLGRTDNPKVNK